ncbi:hypothetical protein [Amycolatopsis eburnea]|uniref:Uncharacterized protein n=1 Tax=Amycolatopsis eburnea TaxID=2267691 RepID=A0A3R9KR68_9PSEU|nr:hypothetical protein [Amycolatopsis eburnea]RSD23671.1 hypothetical protein EIY87_04525 [Amycolatopsis eburnea]
MTRVLELSKTVLLNDVALKLAAFVIAAALVRLFRGPLLNLARNLVKRLPDTVEALLRRGADQLYPSWRSRAGLSRRDTTLEWRLKAVRTSWRPGFFILGGVYLDLMVQPVTLKRLENYEYSNLDRVRYDCGGSACYVGHYLYQNFRHKSYLYSRLGEQTALSSELRTKLDDEEWIRRAHYQRDAHMQSGVSLHLLQADSSYRTTFTHKGALDCLDWGPLLKKLVKKTSRGGVLHVSGYFRTGLHKELCHSLANLSPNLLVCVDHGRFLPEDHRSSADALLEAFSQRLIDLYICTFPELCRLMVLADVESDGDSTVEETLQKFAASGKLPRVTVIRGHAAMDETSAHIILDNELLPTVSVTPGLPPSRDVPGRNNAFNAAVMFYLTKGSADVPLPVAISSVVRQALESWISTARATGLMSSWKGP